MAADDTGITERRTRSGASRFRAEAWDNEAQRRKYKTFPTKAAARAWRRDMQTRIARGEARATAPTTVAEAYEFWITAARSGSARARGGGEYKPSVLHGYEIIFESRLLKAFGRVKVGELRRVSIQRYVDRLVAEGLAAQTIRNIVMALRVLLRWCVREELIATNPCDDLELPSGGGTRDRIASPAEAHELLAALPNARDRAILACAFYAGLRRGELMGLRWEDVHLDAHRIEVRQAYNPNTKTFGVPKSTAGVRVGENAPGIPDVLVPYLCDLTTDTPAEGLVFAGAAGKPFDSGELMRRCMAAWGWRREAGAWLCDEPCATCRGEGVTWEGQSYSSPFPCKDCGGKVQLQPIGLHEARHTYASICIAAGVNIKTISTWMGHSTITITLDRYGHLLPGSAKEALGLLNHHLSKETP